MDKIIIVAEINFLLDFSRIGKINYIVKLPTTYR